MTYKETLEYLFDKTPMFQHRGAQAYKPGIEVTESIDLFYNNPHRSYKTIHIAGTNGKGSVSHTLASILQSAGFKVGLFTSPHLLDFSERIRVNGVAVEKQFVVDFVKSANGIIESIKPSFFEITTIMAFEYFRQNKVDVAIIETGMGGRMDSTNIIDPIMSIITNISYDHIQFLGDKLEKIAWHKSGIIKYNTPVVIGRKNDLTDKVFIEEAKMKNSELFFAEDYLTDYTSFRNSDNMLCHHTARTGIIVNALNGDAQKENARTIITAIDIIISKRLFDITFEDLRKGFISVVNSTNILGRWQKVNDYPIVICDTAHNKDGINIVVNQLKTYKYHKLRIVFGMVSDKDVDSVLSLLPIDAEYYFTKFDGPRTIDPNILIEKAKQINLSCRAYDSVKLAYKEALKDSMEEDLIFVGGSNFIVASFLSYLGV